MNNRSKQIGILRLFSRCALLLVVLLLFSRCPYESPVPIDRPSIKVMNDLLGTWQDPTNVGGRLYVVGQLDDYTYKIEHIFNDSLKESEKYKAHLSLVNKTLFLNLIKVSSFKAKKDKTGSEPAQKHYLLYKFCHNNGVLTLIEVSEFIREKFTKSNELKSFFEHHMDKSYFYNKEELLLVNNYQIEKNGKRMVQLSKTSALQELQLERERVYSTFLISGILFSSFIALFIWYYYHNRQKSSKLQLERKEFAAMLDGQDAERKRIAADLHDRLGSILATVKLYFSSVEDHILKLENENREKFQITYLLLDDACQEVRRIAHDLASDVLVKLGLIPALADLQNTITQSNKINMKVHSFGMEERLEHSVEIMIYRVVQEAVSNVLKHAKAENFTVQLNRTTKNLNFIAEDDGIGFESENRLNYHGMGLKSIEDRVKRLNGKFSIDSYLGKGTSIIIDIPLKN